MTLIGPTVLQGEQGVINGSLIGNTNDLTLDFTTETAIAGDGNGINNLTVVGHALLGASVTTIGSQEYQSPVTLSAATMLTGTSGTFAGGLDGNGNDLTLNFSNVTTIDGSSTFWHLDNLVSKGDVVLNSTISTSGSQTYEQNVSLSGATILVGQNGTFGGPIAGNNNDLTLNFGDTTTITGSQLQDIHNLIVGGGGSIETSGVVSTTGSQQYLDDIVLTGDTTLLSGSATISTQAITDNAANHTLTLGDAGQTGDIVLDGNISIGSLVVGASSFNISITGTDNTFNGTADFKNSGTISLGDEETDTTLFALGLNTTAGSSTNTGGNIRTRGADVVINQINQLANTTIDTTAGNNPTGAQIRLLDGVELNGQELTTDGGTSGSTRVAGDSTIDDGKVIVEEGDLDIGEETLAGNLTLTRDTIFRMDGGGSINIKPNSSIAAATHSLTMVTNELNVDPTAGDITAENITITPQNKSLDIVLGTATGDGLGLGAAAFDHFDSPNIVIGETGYAGTIHVGNLTVSTGQLTLIADGENGSIEIGGDLVSNATSSPSGKGIVIEGSGATTILDANISSNLEVVINDAIEVRDGDRQIITSGADITITGGNGTSNTGIYGNASQTNSLSIDAGTGTVALGELAGFGNGNGTGSLLQNVIVSGSSIELNSTTDSVSGNFEFNGPVTIGGLTSSTLTMSAANISFQSTIDSAASILNGLVLNSQGTTSFSGAIGATNQLGSLTTDAGGTTQLAGGPVNTSDAQTFGDAVILGADTSLSSANGSISFANAVDSDTTARTLNISSGSTVSFDAAVGSSNPLASLTLAATGTTFADDVTTTGIQNYNTPVTLLNDVTFQGGEGQFTGGLDGNQKDLALNFIAPITIDGSETFGNIANLSVQNNANLSGTINTTGFQNYGGAVTLVGDTTLQGTSGTFGGGLDGQTNNLQLEFSSETEIDGSEVFSNIGDLNSTGPVRLRGAISTTGFQNYGDTATLYGDTTLNTGTSGDVSFGGTVDGSHDLTIEAGTGRVDFFNALGASAPLQSLNLASASAVQANSTLAIDAAGGSGAGLRVGPNVDNVNIAQPGSTISNASQDGILFAGGSANSTVGGFTITNSGDNGINLADGDYANTTIQNAVVTTSGSDGFYSNNASGFTITDSNMTLNNGSGVYVDGTASTGVTVRDSSFGIGTGENVAAGNKMYGIAFAGGSNHVADNNTIGGNDLTGLLAFSPQAGTTLTNVDLLNNWVGLTRNEEAVPNGTAGIWVLGDVPGQGSVDTVTIQGNRVSNSLVNGIEINTASNVTIGGSRNDDTKMNLIEGSLHYGLAITKSDGTEVLGNRILNNTESGLYLHEVQNATIGNISADNALHIEGSSFGITAWGDLTGTMVVGNTIENNRDAGVCMVEAKSFTLFRNTIINNGPYGVLAFDDSSGTSIQGNYIEQSDAGVWLSGTSGITIGFDGNDFTGEPGVANKITDNYSVGIIVQGSTAADNAILSNEIYLNTYHGIHFASGSEPPFQLPRLTSASISGDVTAITGTLSGTNGEVYRIQYFKNSPEHIVPGQAPQGRELVAEREVTIGTSGVVDVNIDIDSNKISAGDWITATTTRIISGTPTHTHRFSLGIQAN